MLRRKRKLNRAESLQVRVLHNPVIQAERREDGTVLLKVPRREGFVGKLLGALFMVPKVRKISLDEIGSAVWLMCDGRRSLAEISREVQRENNLHRKEAELAVISFVESLAKKRLVLLKIPERR